MGTRKGCRRKQFLVSHPPRGPGHGQATHREIFPQSSPWIIYEGLKMLNPNVPTALSCAEVGRVMEHYVWLRLEPGSVSAPCPARRESQSQGDEKCLASPPGAQGDPSSSHVGATALPTPIPCSMLASKGSFCLVGMTRRNVWPLPAQAALPNPLEKHSAGIGGIFQQDLSRAR